MGLFENIDGTLAGASQLLGISKSDLPFPTFFGNVTNHAVEDDKSWRSSFGYGFKVVRVFQDGSVTEGPAAPDGTKWGDFILQINQSELSEDEVFAIQVTPTYSGVVVEHQGITIKDLVIKGTTGLSPKRGAGGAFSASGRPVLKAGHSGYWEFHMLRNYIRAYVEHKRIDNKSADEGELRLIWNNFKDHESLYVVPQKFTMNRSARKAHLYDYTIALKAIGNAKEVKKSQSWGAIVDNFIDTVIGDIENGVKILEASTGFVKQVEQDVTATIVTPFTLIGQGLAETQNLKLAIQNAGGNISKLGIKNLLQKVVDTQNNLYDKLLGSEIASYNAAIGKVSTNPDAKGTKNVTFDEWRGINGLMQLKKSGNLMTQSQIDFEKDVKETMDEANGYYADSKRTKANAAAKAGLASLEKKKQQATDSGNIVLAEIIQTQIDELQSAVDNSTSKQGGLDQLDSTKNVSEPLVVQGGTTIQNIAAKTLGSPDKFKELVELNGLKSPYIDPTPLDDDPVRVPGVLRPGDVILIPRSGNAQSPNGVINNGSYPVTSDLTEQQKNFGVDIKLTEDFDIELSPTGDAKLIASTDNVAQAILVKLLLEVGSLKRHPGIGTNLGIGTKAVQPSLVLDKVRSSLANDSRIASVVFAQVTQESNALLIDLVLKLRGYDQPVSLPVKIPQAA